MVKKTKKEREKIIFDAFIKLESNFAGEPVICEQCGKDPPDFICENNKRRIGVELVEWLHEDQTTRTRAFEDIETTIRKEAFPDALKDFMKNHDVSIFTVSIKFPSKSDRSGFISELVSFLNEFIMTPRALEEEENWLNYFNSYHKLKEFVTGISIYETKIPFGIEFVKGGAYSPENAMDALFERLYNKINLNNYKNLKNKLGLSEFYLVVYYSMALIYNSPFLGVKQDIHSIVECAREKLIKNHGPFDKIFLFYALEPRMEVFALSP